jgi:ectoine hydroxylase-related dioxygenase (phytanoyl-CoA dioxygenase family)
VLFPRAGGGIAQAGGRWFGSFNPFDPMFTAQEIAQFHRDGYFIARGLFNREEMENLRTASRQDQAMKAQAHDLKDASGTTTKLALWNQAGDDLFGLVARSERIVNRMEQLLGGEVYHWHSKMSMKEPKVGGAWEWHQDYGYWYNNGCLFPDLASCFIAVDPNTKENGCMQLLRRSHLMGRVNHGRFGDQTGADPERVGEALKRLELVYAVLEPGDALFFHSNTLHCSGQNKSEHPRWSLICCYNTKDNNPYKQTDHPNYEKLAKVPDAAIKAAGVLISENKNYWNKAAGTTEKLKTGSPQPDA